MTFSELLRSHGKQDNRQLWLRALIMLTARCLVLATLLLLGWVRAGSEDFREEEVRFRSGEVMLAGTILIPNGSGQRPALVLVHGAGPGPRERTRLEAEAFARSGVITLSYDKRTQGYSQLERSYGLLADDALAAVRALRVRPEVNREAVGLWGLSEGAWVVPLAAARSDEVAFVVLVAASGVPPAQQHAWSLENQLRHQGVSGSMIEAIARTGVRLLVAADLFAEANHDPVAPLEGVQQPVLALWGDKDRVQPPAESARIVREALQRGGNTHYVIRFFLDAEHALHTSPDGFLIREHFAPGYAEMVASWVKEVARGEAPGPSITGPVPVQARLSRPLTPLAWWESVWLQLGAFALPVFTFASYLAVALGGVLERLIRGRPYALPEQPVRRIRHRACWLAGVGLVSVLGFVFYFGFLIFTEASAVGPVVLGRSLPWLALQALAVATLVLTVLLLVSWWSGRATVSKLERLRLSLLLLGSLLFTLWAWYWNLLAP